MRDGTSCARFETTRATTILGALLLGSALALAACRRPLKTTSSTIAAPAGARWSRAWVESELAHAPPRKLTQDSPGYTWRVAVTLHVERAAPPFTRELFEQTDGTSGWSGRADMLERVARTPVKLRTAADGSALAVAFEDRRWRMLRLDLGDEPIYCPHWAFEDEIPSRNDFVADVLEPGHGERHARRPRDGVAMTYAEEVDARLSYECPRQATGCSDAEYAAATAFACGPAAGVEKIAIAYARGYVDEHGRGDARCVVALAQRWPAARAIVEGAKPKDGWQYEAQRGRLFDAKRMLAK